MTIDEDGNYPLYGVNHFDIQSINVEYFKHVPTQGESKFSGKTAKHVPNNDLFENITKSYTLQITIDEPDDNCDTGGHIYKIFSFN